MRLLSARIMHGPSIYSRMPVVVAGLQLPDERTRNLDRRAMDQIARLGTLVPTIDSGQLVTEPSETDDAAASRVVECLTLLAFVTSALQRWMGVRAGPATKDDKRDPVLLIVPFEESAVALAAIRLSIHLVGVLLDPQTHGEVDSERTRRAIAKYRVLATNRGWTDDYRYVIHAARDRDIPVDFLPMDILAFGHGRRRRLFFRSISDRTGKISAEVSRQKSIVAPMLRAAGVPAPRQKMVHDLQSAIRAANEIGFPVVVKPAQGGRARGVTVGVEDERGLAAAWRRAVEGGRGSRVLVESVLPGDVHRFVVIDGQFISATRFQRARVIGDGRRTIAELIEDENRDPVRRSDALGLLAPIPVDKDLHATLQARGYSLQSVLDQGVALCPHAATNATFGDSNENVTDIVHPDNSEAAVIASRVVGLDIAGVDFMLPDVSRSWRETGGGVCEVNVFSGLKSQYSPFKGSGRDIATPIFEYLFPGGETTRIPILAVYGESLADRIALALSGFLKGFGWVVGCVASSRIEVDGKPVWPDGQSVAARTRAVLGDPRIDALIVQVSDEDANRFGLGFDKCDLVIVVDSPVSDKSSGRQSVLPPIVALLVSMADRFVVTSSLSDAHVERLRKELEGQAVRVITVPPSIDVDIDANATDYDTVDGYRVVRYPDRLEVQRSRAGVSDIVLSCEDSPHASLAAYLVAVADAMNFDETTRDAALKSWLNDATVS